MASRTVQLPAAYDPAPIESKWYQWWIDQNLFDSKVDPTKKAFSIVLPPPNVTGALHMGHPSLSHTLNKLMSLQVVAIDLDGEHSLRSVLSSVARS